jgi:predicted PurR-regulated permease PerM
MPVPRRLQQYHLPYRRQILALTTISTFLLPFLFLIGYTLVLVLPEIQRFFGGDSPGAAYLSAFQSSGGSGVPEPLVGLGLGDIASMSPEDIVALINDPAVQTWLQGTVSTLFDSISLIATAALYGFILLAGTYYLLTDGPRLRDWFLDNLDQSGVVESYATSVDKELSSILFGNILNAFITGIIGILAFSAYNLIAPDAVTVPFAPLVGALTGAGSLIPVVGMKIVYIPVAVLLTGTATVSGQPDAVAFVALFLIIAFVFVDTIPDFLIRPYVSGSRTHVGLLMFAYILGPIAFGFYGIFLAPILLVLVSEFFRKIIPYILTGRPAGQQSTLSEY